MKLVLGRHTMDQDLFRLYLERMELDILDFNRKFRNSKPDVIPPEDEVLISLLQEFPEFLKKKLRIVEIKEKHYYVVCKFKGEEIVIVSSNAMFDEHGEMIGKLAYNRHKSLKQSA